MTKQASDNRRSLARILLSLSGNRSGNFALTFALLAVPVMAAIGCSFDYVHALNVHRKMQSDLDAALVTAVKSVGTKDSDTLKAEIARWLEAEAEIKNYYVLDTSGIEIDATAATIVAKVSASVPTTFLKIINIDSVPVAAKAGVKGGQTVTKTAFSMYLVLDRSGSMKETTNTTYSYACSSGTCSKKYTKMEALKLAVQDLTTQLSTADPSHNYVRTGAVSYDNKMDTPSNLNWGTSDVVAYVNNLSPRSYTDSSLAMQTALAALTTTAAGKDENAIHGARTGLTPSKYIVFMTDGANNIKNADTNTRTTCDSARTQNVRVYTIAFMAPIEGQTLLQYCATTSGDYFEADSTAGLIEAFRTIGETSSNNLVRLTQ